MLVLAWDTATPVLSLALARIAGDDRGEPETLECRSGTGLSTHSSLLPRLAEEALAAGRLGVKDLSLIACGRGPGSFTGLRVGLAFAKGLAFGGPPLVGVSTLDALASNPDLGEGLFAAVLDARRREVFFSLYRRLEGGPAIPLSGILVLSPGDFYRSVKELLTKDGNISPGEVVTVVGPGAELVAPPEDGFRIGPSEGPRASLVAALGARLFRSADPAENPPLPLYGRSPEIFKTWTPPARLVCARPPS
ncbi:MAG: tRNA (adenosine(37)-N6)-threonylcarbamoyltransferase complex dimerization subunit type 1 TsaB [Deltaproteobacteria bacterium]|nr:tRNA (adenosine(37)-N6)-threonylcarbamoyltransferase complex dimerization subunit type 1 TsaB [Deltaproteobacteria bacterium]